MNLRRTAIALASLLALLPAVGAGGLRAGEEPDVPAYEFHASDDTPPLHGSTRTRVARALVVLASPPSPDDAADAVRYLAGVGPAAAQAIVTALPNASWPARATLVTALGEMDYPAVTAVLSAATRDPSFAVREAAVRGLGKTGDERALSALEAVGDATRERVWSVRAEVATALRRGILRKAYPREASERLLMQLLEDRDRDVRIRSLEAVGPLAVQAAVPLLLTTYADRTMPREERTLALRALRLHRSHDETLLEALRSGFIDQGDESVEEARLAVEAGRALLEIQGSDALVDDEIGDAAMRRLMGPVSGRMRYALGRAGFGASDWLDTRARFLARRYAAGRTQYAHEVVEALVDTLIEVDRPRAVQLLKDWIGGDEAGVLAFETRRFALTKVQVGFSGRLGAELRRLYDEGAAQGLEADLLRAIVESGGDDLAARLDAALMHAEIRVRRRALDLLRRREDVAHGPNLTALASGDAPDSLRLDALEVLAARDPAGAFERALIELEQGGPTAQRKAVSILSGSRAAEHFELLVRELEKTAEPEPTEIADDGDDGGQPGEDLPDPGSGAAVTASSPDRLTLRQSLRRELLHAIRLSGGKAARPYLLAVASSDERTELRRVAVAGLREIAQVEDAPLLLELAQPQVDSDIRDLAVRVLSRLDQAPGAVALFERQVASRRDRAVALRVLREEESTILPTTLEKGVLEPDWEDGERESALALLERADRVPSIEVLVQVAAQAHGPDLCREALRQLQAHGGDDARRRLLRLLTEFEDREKVAFVAQQLGRAGSPESVDALVAVLRATRADALAAPAGTSAAVRVYRECAVALGRCGGDAAARALVADLLHPDVVRAGARYSVEGNGPFFPPRAPVPKVVRALVRGFARQAPGRCRDLLREALAAREEAGTLLTLDEEYVDGVARYLHDPVAYKLPGRRRPAAALLLRSLVPRIAPRLSTNDREAYGAMASQLGSENRFDEALAARRAQLRIADVEYAQRDRETRLWEQGRVLVTEARVLASQDRTAAAHALLGTLREADPNSADLAYLQAYGLLKTGGSAEIARAALEESILRDTDRASAHFYLAWLVLQTEGPGPALRHYEEAVKRDFRRVHAASNEYLTHRRGLLHPWSYYVYGLARALSLAGDGEAARSQLTRAVIHDDREADLARRDAAFEGWDDLEPLLERTLSRMQD